MKKCYYYLLLIVVAMLGVACGPQRSQASYDFASKVLSTNYDGSYVIRVFVRARNASIAFTDGQRKVVDEVIFSGVAPASDGVSRLEPLCMDKNARAKNEDFFNAFFADKGDWQKFASLEDKRTGTTHYERDGKQMLERLTVTVKRAELKKYLQDAGIIPVENLYQLK